MSTNTVDEDDEDDEDTDLNMEEREIVRKKMFEDKPEKTQEGRTIYDNIIRCLKSKMLTKEEKITEVQGILDNITDTEVLKMAVNRGLQSSPQVSPTPLFIASNQGYYDIVVLLLSKGADITESVKLRWGKYPGKKNDYFVTPLFVAAMNGYEDIVKVFLDKHEEIVPRLKLRYDNNDSRNVKLVFKNTSIDRVDYSSWEWNSEKNNKKPPTPLFVAAYAGHCNIIQLLVEHNADINWQDDDGMTALWLATEFGELEMVKCLLEQGANPNIATDGGYERDFSNGLNTIDVTLMTPLFISITGDGDVNFQIIKLLLENKANVDQPVKKWYNGYTFNITPLHIAVQIAKNSGYLIKRRSSLIKIIKLLLRYEADINFFDSERPNKMSPLTIVEGDNELKDLLLTYLDVNFKVNSMYEKMMSNNMPQDLAAIQSIDMLDKDGISDIAETIKIARENSNSNKRVIEQSETKAKASEEEKKGGVKINKKFKINTTKLKKKTKKHTRKRRRKYSRKSFSSYIINI